MMKRLLAFTLVLLSVVLAAASDYVPRDLVWTTQSANSSGSMPCGGHDIGLNVWVEQGDVLFYAQQSGWFDENNTLLKAGRWRLHVAGNPLNGTHFEQRLCLDDGAVYISGGGLQVCIWADVQQPVVYVNIVSKLARSATLSYESWRWRDRPLTKAECQQCSYKWVLPANCTTFADSIAALQHSLTFAHTNRDTTVFDFTVEREHLNAVKDSLDNPIGGRSMGGTMSAPGFRFAGTATGTYASTDYKSWNFVARRLKNTTVSIALYNSEKCVTAVADCPPDASASQLARQAAASRQRSAAWWHAFWQRSWIVTDNVEAHPMVRNYELMRYLLGCNAKGQWPTKFNGGLFTFDPVYVDSAMAFTPDYRKWGGGTMTAQNQRLVYWPLLKSGDCDLMEAQTDTYLRMLHNAQVRTRHYWQHGGAAFTEQTENFGLPNPAEYGKHKEGDDLGVEKNKWLEYEWDTALEFCQMAILMQHTDPHAGYERYNPLVAECLRFFDEHYRWEALRRGLTPTDSTGHLVIYPGSGCETFKMARNPASTIAALRTVAASANGMEHLLRTVPPIPLTIVGTDTCIAPAESWERIQNVETPQLYPVWPWRLYGVGRPGLQTALNTYWKDPHAVEMRSTKGWKQDNIWAACLGLTDEARRLNLEKLADGPYRFTAFWNPGFDWAPDHNRGGAGMIGLQEMLLQETPNGKLILFPAWPTEWDCSFRLVLPGRGVVEATMKNGQVTQQTVH